MNRITSINIKGYRPFKDFTANFGPLEVIVGANGSGKSALFEFMKFLRDSTQHEIPPGIIEGYVGQQVFNRNLSLEAIMWDLSVELERLKPLSYSGTLNGPMGRPNISFEIISIDLNSDSGLLLMEAKNNQARIYKWDAQNLNATEYYMGIPKNNQLAIGLLNNTTEDNLYKLREYISQWQFYSANNISTEKLRRPVLIEQTPLLTEDASNLSAVLFHLMTEYPRSFEELQSAMRGMVPSFKELKVKARGAPGEVIAFWYEGNDELTLADVSDGILRLLCWTVLCVMPNHPSLICIDEPDQGVHPRTLPILAALFQKASERTQVLLATHSSYFLTQFDFENIAVMRKKGGDVEFIKPADSKVMLDMLEDFGADEVERLHRTDELEMLP